jgi:ankyrin repeat protein
VVEKSGVAHVEIACKSKKTMSILPENLDEANVANTHLDVAAPEQQLSAGEARQEPGAEHVSGDAPAAGSEPEAEEIVARDDCTLPGAGTEIEAGADPLSPSPQAACLVELPEQIVAVLAGPDPLAVEGAEPEAGPERQPPGLFGTAPNLAANPRVSECAVEDSEPGASEFANLFDPSVDPHECRNDSTSNESADATADSSDSICPDRQTIVSETGDGETTERSLHMAARGAARQNVTSWSDTRMIHLVVLLLLFSLVRTFIGEAPEMRLDGKLGAVDANLPSIPAGSIVNRTYESEQPCEIAREPSREMRDLVEALRTGDLQKAIDLPSPDRHETTRGPDGQYYWTLLHWASFFPTPFSRAIKEFLSDGANYEAIDSAGWTPRHVAAYYGNLMPLQTLDFYVEADMHEQDDLGRTPLHLAAWQGHEQIVQWLADRPSETLRDVDSHKRTVFHYAAMGGHICVMRTLISVCNTSNRTFSDLLNARDRDGRTALHAAAQGAYEAIAELLVNAGAKRTVADNTGKRPVEYAVSSVLQRLLA